MHLRILVYLLFLTFLTYVQGQSLSNVISLDFEDATRGNLSSPDTMTFSKGVMYLCTGFGAQGEISSYKVINNKLIQQKQTFLDYPIRSWQIHGHELVGLEMNTYERKVLFFNGNLEKSRDLSVGLSAISDIGFFSNDKMIIFAQSISPTRITENDVMDDPLNAAQIMLQGENYKGFMVFLVDQDFNLLAPLVENYKGMKLISRDFDHDHVDVLKYRVTFRLNPAKSFAALFNQHRGDITIFSMDGQRLAEIRREHAGMIPNPDRFPLYVPEGEKVWYQADVLLDGDIPTLGRPAAFSELYLYVSEAGPQKIEVYKITGYNQTQFLGTFSTPFPVMKMAKSQEGFKSYLYMVDRDGGIHRSDFPNPADLAPAFKRGPEIPEK